jgi:ribosomal protein L3
MATTAIVGEKVGMSQKWVDDKIVPVTVLRVEPMRVVQVKTPERDGYSALQVTYGHRDAKKLTKPEAGHFAKASVDPASASSSCASSRSTASRSARRSSSTPSPPAARST